MADDDAYRRDDVGTQLDLSTVVEPRSHFNFDVRGGQEYYGRDDGRGAPHVMTVGDSLGASYDCCSCGEILCSYNRSETTIPNDDHRIMRIGGSDPAVATHQFFLGFERVKKPLPPDASCTLFVEGIPRDCSLREVAHIFRPFVGYKEVRLVTPSRYCNGDLLVDCFVYFEGPKYAATALDCLQGYRFDELDQDHVRLRLHFAHRPGARSGDEHHGRS